MERALSAAAVLAVVTALSPAAVAQASSEGFRMVQHAQQVAAGTQQSESFRVAACLTDQPAGLSKSDSFVAMSGCAVASSPLEDDRVPEPDPDFGPRDVRGDGTVADGEEGGTGEEDPGDSGCGCSTSRTSPVPPLVVLISPVVLMTARRRGRGRALRVD